MQRLLCVTAHPDDEVVAFGGTLLKHRRNGGTTRLVSLTRGEAATHRGSAATAAALAAARDRELADACARLGLSHAEALTYPDGHLDGLPFIEVVGRLTQIIRAWRPQVVMTFGPEGGTTAHADHAMTSLFTTAAFHAAARADRVSSGLAPAAAPPWQPQKLYFATATPATLSRGIALPAPASARIDVTALVEEKIEAFRAHVSQAPLFPLIARVLRRHGGLECFHLAASRHAAEPRMETDLFDGVADDA